LELKKELTLIDVFSVATGAMISSGLFILPGLAHAIAGPAVILSYMLAGIVALAGVMSVAELATAMPRAGGDYFFIARGLGSQAGTVAGLLSWFSLSLKSAFALIGMAAFASLFTSIDMRIIASLLAIVFTLINLVGIKEAGRVQVVLVVGLIFLLGFYIIKGIPHVSLIRLEPFSPNGAMAVVATSGFVFISYGGLLKVVSIAEEIKNPGRDIPLGMILSLLVVSVLYTLTVLVTTGVMDRGELNTSLTPISDGAYLFLGTAGKVVMSVAAVLAFISTANAGLMSASRYPLGLSRDGLLPKFFAGVHRRFKTPVNSLIVTGAMIIVFLFLKLDLLVKVASSVVILTYLLSCLSVIIMREGKVLNYRPVFRAPLYPVVQIVGIGFFAFMLYQMGSVALLATAGFVVLGFLVYLFYGRTRSKNESALLHLVERITDKELTTGLLEEELREIIFKRDDIVKDRFDRIVDQAIVLDIDEPMDRDKFFKTVAENLSSRLDIAPEKLLLFLKRREEESSTAITPMLAIPHIVIDGEGKFCMLLARSKTGIKFNEEFPSVKAVFVLIGTRDERNFHLKALSSIAQIVSDTAFEKNWLEARDERGLKDVILLGRRMRF